MTDFGTLAQRLADQPTSGTRHMGREERAAGIRQMLDDLYRLAREDGCIAAGWVIEMIAELAPPLRPVPTLPSSLEDALRSLPERKNYE